MTMYRYIALMWSRTDHEAATAAKFLAAKLPEISPHQWSPAWDGAGLAIYHAGEHKGRMQTYRLQGERGAVLGRLFRKDYSSVVDDLDEFESRKCLDTRGQRLIDDYWGRYVAFLNDPATGTRYVMRDPTGAFPCYHTLFRGVTIYFSDMQDAANFDFLPFTVNWDCVKSAIALGPRQQVHTGLNEVGEVLPAERVEITPFETKSRFVWNPTEISQTDVVEDPEEAAELLRETVMSTIGALAGCYDRVVHNLGGLDSSIVLACMAQAPKRPEITCINFHTRSPRGEERHYSRQIADKYGVELVEKVLDYRKADLSRMFTSNKLARPLGYFDCQGLTGDVLALAKERNAQALFYGVGGDNVFFQPARNFGALDFVRRHGLFRRNSLSVAMEASRYGRRSLVLTAREMLRERLAPPPCFNHVHEARNEMAQKLHLVNPQFRDVKTCERFLHPLLVPQDRDLKGKFLHIWICALYSIYYYDHWDTEYFAERIRSYLAQPIIEACLRTPVWILTYGGVDRGLARKAFQEDLPQQITKRFSKSTPSEYYRDLYENNIDFLQHLLQDGILVREKILLRDKLKQALGQTNVLLHIWHSQVLGLAGMEAWLKTWIERPAVNLQALDVAG